MSRHPVWVFALALVSFSPTSCDLACYCNHRCAEHYELSNPPPSMLRLNMGETRRLGTDDMWSHWFDDGCGGRNLESRMDPDVVVVSDSAIVRAHLASDPWPNLVIQTRGPGQATISLGVIRPADSQFGLPADTTFAPITVHVSAL